MEEVTIAGRLEAFSDGVFAVAITLLVLDLKVPRAAELPEGKGLLSALLKQWPAYLAYIISFAFILIMWVNHHEIFRRVKRSDHYLLLLNGLLLMGVCLVPFSTSLLAEYIQKHDQHTAAAIYSGAYVLIAIFFNLLWRYAAHEDRLLDRDEDPRFVRQLSRQYSFGPLLYLVSFILAFINVPACLALNFGLAVLFALPTSEPGASTR
ncbi:MAG: TMEM175 family protein [Dehalococcoidia bacterium]